MQEPCKWGAFLRKEGFSAAPGVFQFAGEFMITRADIQSRATDYQTLTRYAIAPLGPGPTTPSSGSTAVHPAAL